MLKKLRPLILLAIGGMLLSITSFFIWLLVNGTRPDIVVFGEVVRAGNSVVLIEGRDERFTRVHLTPQTQIVRGSDGLTVDALDEDMLLQIIGKPAGKGDVNANFIRILNTSVSGSER